MLIKNNEKGQAIFEFVIFIPFLLIFIATLVTVIGAVNGSINQVKATRNYFYMTANNNSMLPAYGLLKQLKNAGIGTVGIASIGWQVRSEGESSVAPCYKIGTFVGETPLGEECADKVDINDSISTFIKIKTMYGLCGATYDLSNGATPILAHEISAGGLSCLLAP